MKVVVGYSLVECKSLCRDDPDCQGGYHADGQRKNTTALLRPQQRYVPACYLLGVEGAKQKPCNVPNTETATKFECFPRDCDAEPEVTRLCG